MDVATIDVSNRSDFFANGSPAEPLFSDAVGGASHYRAADYYTQQFTSDGAPFVNMNPPKAAKNMGSHPGIDFDD